MIVEFDEAIKGYTKMPGLFTCYRKKQESKDSILMEIPKRMLGRNVFIQATASTGTLDTPVIVFHGQEIGDAAFQMDMVDDGRILFKMPNMSFRAPNNAESARTLTRTLPNQILSSFEVKATQKESGNVLIDVTSFYKSDFIDFASGLQGSSQDLVTESTPPTPTSTRSKVLPEKQCRQDHRHRLTWHGADLTEKEEYSLCRQLQPVVAARGRLPATRWPIPA